MRGLPCTAAAALLAAVLEGLLLGTMAAPQPQHHQSLPYMRRGEQRAVHSHRHVGLTAEGSVLDLSTSMRDRNGTMTTASESLPDMDEGSDACNYSFVLGEEKADGCPAMTEVIEKASTCITAAKWSGASINASDFYINDFWRPKLPRGCFSVTDESGETKFYLNSRAAEPDDIEKGKPVCLRPKYLLGTVDSNGGCPTGYENLMNETICIQFSSCNSNPDEPVFTVSARNASLHRLHPPGCSIDDAHRVAFNPTDEHIGDPDHPRGIPVCIVTEQLSFS